MHPCSSQLAGPIRDGFVGSRRPLIGTDAVGLHGDTFTLFLTDYTRTVAAEHRFPGSGALWSAESSLWVRQIQLFNEADTATQVNCLDGDSLIYISAYLSIHTYISESSLVSWFLVVKALFSPINCNLKKKKNPANPLGECLHWVAAFLVISWDA